MDRKRCTPVEEMEGLLDLPEDAPRRRHLDECPRCRVLFNAYREFRDPDSDVPTEDLRDAETRLSEALRSEIHRGRMEGGAHAPRRKAPSFRFPRTLAAIAAGILVLFLADTVLDRREGGRPPVLRGVPDDVAAPAKEAVVLHDPLYLPGGGIELRWNSWEDADAYRIRLYTPEIEELPPIADVTDPRVVLRAGELGIDLEPGSRLLWRVAALRWGDEIAVSPLGSFRLP